MNERIQKWLKNHLVRDEYTEFGWQECHRYEFDENEIKEFTELIVRECVEVVKWTPSQFPNDEYVKNIQEHFGVNDEQK